MPFAEQIRQLQRERNDATNQLAGLLAENAQLQSDQKELELLKLRGEVARSEQASSDDPREALVKSWLERRDELKQLVEQNPDKSIPEFQLLSEQQWLDVALSAKFGTDKDTQRDLTDLRQTAENDFATEVHNALSQYMSDYNGRFPTDLSQLQP